MLYSQDDIKNIHSSSLAIEKTIYTDYGGIQYIGMSTGRLALYTPLPETAAIVQEPAQVEVVEETTPIVEDSYFAIDSEGDLTPLNFISNLLVDNIFKLNTVNGDLNPSESESIIDGFFEINSNGDITPKVL